MHSLVCFKDKNGRTIDFYRLKQKRPATVLQKVYEGFAKAESMYLSELQDGCTEVTIHYTEYEAREDELTYKCSFDEFIKNYNEYKQK